MALNTTLWIVTKSERRIKFKDWNLPPYEGGPLSVVNEVSLDIAASLFGAFCATLDQGCVQIFDTNTETEHGFFMI